MAKKSGASKGAKKINAFRDGDFKGAVATLGTLHHADRIGNTPAWQNRNKLDKYGKPLYKIGDDVWRRA